MNVIGLDCEMFVKRKNRVSGHVYQRNDDRVLLLLLSLVTYRTLASVCLRFLRNLWYFCRSPMLPCSACILANAAVAAAAVAVAAACGAWLLVDAVLLLQLRSVVVPPLPHVSVLVVLVTLFVRRFFLRLLPPRSADAAAAAAATAGAVALDQAAADVAAAAAAGVPDEDVGDGLLAVRRATVSEHELLDSGQSSSANVG